jgi:hypothetical protein
VSRDELGFLDSPINGLGIIRARTLLGNLRLWDIPRSEQALQMVIQEIGVSPIPALYILIDDRSEKKVYIGQSEDISARLTSHLKSADPKIKNWQRALILNDGRNASQSDLNDENIRLTLENYLVSLFKLNRYQVVTAVTRQPSLSSLEAIIVAAFRQEINILLSNKGRISRFLSGKRDDEFYLDKVRKILSRKGYQVDQWGEKYAMVNGKPVIIRPGSLKQKGWQVTFRGSKSLAQLKKGEGTLLMPRGQIVYLPLQEIADFIRDIDPQAFERDTLDIFIRFEEEQLWLVYKNGQKDITPTIFPYSEKKEI